MKKLSIPQSAGWVFFILVTLLLIYPLYLFMSSVTVDSDEAMQTRVTFSIFGAAMASAFITWLCNMILERVTLLMQPPPGKDGKRKKK